MKRLFRIVPRYGINFVICVLVVAPFVGGTLSLSDLADEASLMLYLACVAVPGAFKGLPYATLNGSLWTIAYEFRCYIVTIGLGVMGLHAGRSRWLLLAPSPSSRGERDRRLAGRAPDPRGDWGEPAKTSGSSRPTGSDRSFSCFGTGSL